MEFQASASGVLDQVPHGILDPLLFGVSTDLPATFGLKAIDKETHTVRRTQASGGGDLRLGEGGVWEQVALRWLLLPLAWETRSRG